jgi:hypothetical protein
MGKATPRTTATKTGRLLDRLRSKPLGARCCKSCGRPQDERIEPIPTMRFNVGNAEVQLFESFPFGKLRREFKVQCWRISNSRWYAQSVFSEHEFRNLALVVLHALQVMDEECNSKEKQSS